MPGLSDNKLHALYIMYSPSTNLFKIGTTVNVPRRLKEIQKVRKRNWVCYDAADTTLIACTDYCLTKCAALHLEAKVHKKFKHKRTPYSEWFLLNEVDVTRVINYYIKLNAAASETTQVR